MPTLTSQRLREEMRGLALFVWNGKEKKFLGRGARSWAEICTFYVIYYVCLTGFFVGLMAVFFQTIDADCPKLVGDSSYLDIPGMGFRPMPDERNRLIYFVEREKDSFKAHVQSIKERLKPYIEAEASGIGRDCSQGFDPAADEACAVSVAQLTQNCNEENDFGYGLSPAKPCVLLGLNKIFGWMPEEYTPDNIDVIGADQEQILAKPDMIYVRCRGENAADVDNLGTDITYYPDQGFPHYYYPYTNQKDYLAPLVFVQFGSVQLGVALMVECRALAPNIHHDNTDKDIGGVRFQLLVD